MSWGIGSAFGFPPRQNAIHFPSGDQAGKASSDPDEVNWTGSLSPTRIVYIWAVVCFAGTQEKATLVPSGERATCRLFPPDAVSGTRFGVCSRGVSRREFQATTAIPAKQNKLKATTAMVAARVLDRRFRNVLTRRMLGRCGSSASKLVSALA